MDESLVLVLLCGGGVVVTILVIVLSPILVSMSTVMEGLGLLFEGISEYTGMRGIGIGCCLFTLGVILACIVLVVAFGAGVVSCFSDNPARFCGILGR
jgi:hypothetical protein